MADPHHELFATIVETRNTELSALWTRFNIHLLINGGYLLAVTTAHEASSFIKSTGIAPQIFGLLLTLLWFLSERAGRSALHYRDDKIKEYESRFWADEPLKSYNLFRDPPCHLMLQSYVSVAVIAVFGLAWAFLLVSAVCS